MNTTQSTTYNSTSNASSVTRVVINPRLNTAYIYRPEDIKLQPGMHKRHSLGSYSSQRPVVNTSSAPTSPVHTPPQRRDSIKDEIMFVDDSENINRGELHRTRDKRLKESVDFSKKKPAVYDQHTKFFRFK